MVDARGNWYKPTAVPQSGGVDRIREWLGAELERIASVMRAGRSQWLTLDILAAAPDKPIDGMVAYFKAGVVGVDEGLYERRAGAWIKL